MATQLNIPNHRTEYVFDFDLFSETLNNYELKINELKLIRQQLFETMANIINDDEQIKSLDEVLFDISVKIQEKENERLNFIATEQASIINTPINAYGISYNEMKAGAQVSFAKLYPYSLPGDLTMNKIVEQKNEMKQHRAINLIITTKTFL